MKTTPGKRGSSPPPAALPVAKRKYKTRTKAAPKPKAKPKAKRGKPS